MEARGRPGVFRPAQIGTHVAVGGRGAAARKHCTALASEGHRGSHFPRAVRLVKGGATWGQSSDNSQQPSKSHSLDTPLQSLAGAGGAGRGLQDEANEGDHPSARAASLAGVAGAADCDIKADRTAPAADRHDVEGGGAAGGAGARAAGGRCKEVATCGAFWWWVVSGYWHRPARAESR